LLLEQTFEEYPHSLISSVLEVSGEMKMTTIAINPFLAKDARRVKTPINQGPAALRLTPRGRGLARLAVISSLSILLLSGFAAFNGATAGSNSESISSPYVKISVKPGDTLWSIAEGIAKSPGWPEDLYPDTPVEAQTSFKLRNSQLLLYSYP
jgi:hypothetical protein